MNGNIWSPNSNTYLSDSTENPIFHGIVMHADGSLPWSIGFSVPSIWRPYIAGNGQKSRSRGQNVKFQFCAADSKIGRLLKVFVTSVV